VASVRAIMKFRQRPFKSLIGIKFKFSHELSMPFHIESPPPPVSKFLKGREGEKEGKWPPTTTRKKKNF